MTQRSESTAPAPNLHHIEVDVQNFRAEELTVNVVSKKVVVEGKHSFRLEKSLNHYFLAKRKFEKTYSMPNYADMDLISCIMTTDNYLYISTPLRNFPDSKHGIVPIQISGMNRLQMASAQELIMQIETDGPRVSSASADAAPQAYNVNAGGEQAVPSCDISGTI